MCAFVQIGEKVWSRDEQTGEVALAEVVETFVRADQALVSVTFGNANTHETIRSTTEHPYWTKRGWIAANELMAADHVLSRSGEWLPVVSVGDSDEKSTVYNFEVKGSHSYFVGEQGALVHNVSKANLGAGGVARATTDVVATRNGLVNVRATIDRIKAGGRFPHRNDGSVFQNREGLLPRQPQGYYREYVHPTPGVNGPGAQRIIQGQNGELYYSPDHYGTFIPLN